MTVLSRVRDEFSDRGIYIPVNSPQLIDICQDKAATFSHLQKHGFTVPEYREMRSLVDLNGFKSMPAILKPSVGGGGSANVFIAQTPAELEMFARYLLQIYDRFLLQEYVGTPDREFTVGVLFGADGAMINSIAIRRIINNALTIRTRVPNRSGRAELGEMLVVSTGISQGHVAAWPAVRRQCEAIACSLAPRAPVNIQCRLVGDQVVPFEINPRFSGTTSLRAMVGYNEPDTLIRRDVLGVNIDPKMCYEECIILRSLYETKISPSA